jgi:hypothetical protein
LESIFADSKLHAQAEELLKIDDVPAGTLFSVTVRGDIVLPPGSLLLMAPAFQRDWEHAVLPHPQVAAPRLNLTFRRVGG